MTGYIAGMFLLEVSIVGDLWDAVVLDFPLTQVERCGKNLIARNVDIIRNTIMTSKYHRIS